MEEEAKIEGLIGSEFDLVVLGARLTKEDRTCLQFQVGAAIDGEVVWTSLGWRVKQGKLFFPASKLGGKFFPMHKLLGERMYKNLLKTLQDVYASQPKFGGVHFPPIWADKPEEEKKTNEDALWRNVE